MKWISTGNNRLLISVSSVMSAAVGGAVGYVVASRILEKKFQEKLQAELADSEEYFREKYQAMYSTPIFVADEDDKDDDTEVYNEAELQAIREATDAADPVPVDLVGQALSAGRTYQADNEDNQREPGDDRPAPVIVNNIFQNIAPDPERTMPSDEVVEALLASRDPAAGPYIITKEEFYENPTDNEQAKYTYWDQDRPDVLVADDDEFNPIVDIEGVAGEDNLLHFGYGSGDLEVLYIRNDLMNLDMHITRSSGRYADEVMGPEVSDGPHLKHSQPRKFRIRDE